MARKTIEVNALIVMVNEMCAKSTCSASQRQGAINVLEGVLFRTDNYRGFRYLTTDEVPAGEVPGIYPRNPQDARFENTDNTRVYYNF